MNLEVQTLVTLSLFRSSPDPLSEFECDFHAIEFSGIVRNFHQRQRAREYDYDIECVCEECVVHVCEVRRIEIDAAANRF